MRMRLLCNDSMPEKIQVAATFVDACAPNYAHWMTEVLPRIATFCSVREFSNVPIIINDDLHPNIIESLSIIVGSKREIIALPVGRGIQVNELYITSVTGYVPFERRNHGLSGHSHGKFSPRAFELLGNKISLFISGLPSFDLPEKFYIHRGSCVRKVINESEIEDFLLDKSYSIITPDKLTFLQQVRFFNYASVITGSSGAALANLLFASSQAKVIILIGRYKETSYWYWQNIACASGKTIHYVFSSGDVPSIHADFEIDLQNINDGAG